jgi:hypothetical protein
MIRLLLPFASPLFRERVQRNLAWRWFVAREARRKPSIVSKKWQTLL